MKNRIDEISQALINQQTRLAEYQDAISQYKGQKSRLVREYSCIIDQKDSKIKALQQQCNEKLNASEDYEKLK